MTSIAEGTFWIAAIALFYIYFGYPTLLGVLSVFCCRLRREPGWCPRVSILIAAYNEQADIGRKIQETLQLDYPSDRMEILVLSDASTDGTDEIVKSFSDSRVRLLRMEKRRGKTHAQNEGVKACTGEIVVFSDATTIYHSQALRYLACNYQGPEVGAVSGRYRYFDREGGSPTGFGTITFWNYENLIKKLQSRIRTITGCCGCIYSVRKDAYTALPANIISDLVQPLCVIQKGYRVVFEDRALAYEETTKSSAEEFSMRVRVVTRAMRGILSVPDLLKPWKHGWIAFQLMSHKVLRWLVPLFLVALLLSNAVLAADAGMFRMLFGLQVLFYVVALIAAWLPATRWWKPLTVPLYFCTLNAAALVGLIGVIRGREYVVWETIRPSTSEN
jgi:cellulose synthase/poly-beta-1,6-N-acetylglucosamine synthase-like glycosyltransferase